MVDRRSYAFAARLWVHSGEGGWHFLTVPTDISADTAECTTRLRRGSGSVRVAAVVSTTAWRTSLFPDAQARSYLLPVKKSVRGAAKLRAGDVVRLEPEADI